MLTEPGVSASLAASVDTPKKVTIQFVLRYSSVMEQRFFLKTGRRAVLKMWAVMGVFGGSSCDVHPTTMMTEIFLNHGII